LSATVPDSLHHVMAMRMKSMSLLSVAFIKVFQSGRAMCGGILPGVAF